MSNLQREINRIEAHIELENAYIQVQHILLNEYFATSKLLPYSMIGGLIAGFLFARKKSLFQLLKSFFKIGIPVTRLYSRIKFFLPL